MYVSHFNWVSDMHRSWAAQQSGCTERQHFQILKCDYKIDFIERVASYCSIFSSGELVLDNDSVSWVIAKAGVENG